MRRGAALAAAVALVGAPVGLVWAATTPRADLVAVEGGGLRLADIEDKAFIATDATFFLMTFALGVLVGVAAWFVGSRWSVGAVLGAVVGGALAAAIAVQAGELYDSRLGSFDDRDRSPSEGVPLELPNELLPDSSRAPLLLLGWPAGAALGFAATASLRIGPPAPVSSGRRSSGRSRAWGPPAAPGGAPPRA